MCFYTVPREPTRILQGVREGSGNRAKAQQPAGSL